MISLKRTNQGGGAVTFIIIAVVLAFAVVGTTFLVKQRGEQVRRDQAVAQADSTAKKEAAKADESATPVDENEKGGASENVPAVETPASAPSTATDQPSALPTTGPESIILQLVAVVLLIGASSVYVSSRRATDRSL